MAYKILISDKIEAVCLEILKEAGFDVEYKPGLSPEDLKAIIGQYHGLVVRSATKVTADILAGASNLRIIGRAGAGVDTIDVRAATQRKIIVMNTPGQNSNAVAELALGMMFALARTLITGTTSLRAGRWEKKSLTGVELAGRSVGVIGYGAIGQILGRLAGAMGMKVLAYDPLMTDQQLEEAGARAVSLDTLLKESDFVSLHLPKNEQTTNIIDQAALDKMKPTAYLVNCARGGLVDEAALYETLKAGRLAGAAADVFVKEPPEDVRLFELENFICTPHIGAQTEEAQLNVAVAVAKQMAAYFKDGSLVGAVNA